MSLKIKVGCDPEFFLQTKDGKIVSAEGIIPGDKLNPHKVKKGTIQVDGFAAEIGIEPAESREEFCDNVETVLEELKKYTGDHTFLYEDHTVFTEEVYKAQSKKGRELGCDPDYDAYKKLANPSPTPNPISLRTASGHIHAGWGEGLDITDPNHFQDCCNVAKQLDWYVGVPSLLWNKGTVRRSLYGKAGAFRPKSYGVEYRTPDNAWLVSRARMGHVFDNTILGIQQLLKGRHVYNDYNAAQLINSGNSTKAREYCAAIRIPYLEDKPMETPILKPKKTMPKVAIA